MSLQAGKRMFMREIEVKGPRGGSIRRSGVGRGRWKKNAFRPGSEIGRAKSRRYVLANTTRVMSWPIQRPGMAPLIGNQHTPTT
jgi:hypothetical protein